MDMEISRTLRIDGFRADAWPSVVSNYAIFFNPSHYFRKRPALGPEKICVRLMAVSILRGDPGHVIKSLGNNDGMLVKYRLWYEIVRTVRFSVCKFWEDHRLKLSTKLSRETSKVRITGISSKASYQAPANASAGASSDSSECEQSPSNIVSCRSLKKSLKSLATFFSSGDIGPVIHPHGHTSRAGAGRRRGAGV